MKIAIKNNLLSRNFQMETRKCTKKAELSPTNRKISTEIK